MTGNKAEAKAIEIIKSLGYNVTVCDQQTDYNGVDCVIDGKNVDVKGEVTLQKYPDTFLLSLKKRKPGQEWKKPKYLERNDVQVWVVDVTGGSDVFVFTPEKLAQLEMLAYGGSLKTKYKKAENDYFGNEHLLAVVPKSRAEKLPRKYTLPSGHQFIKWNDLSPEERAENTRLSRIVVKYCLEHIGSIVTYNQINKMGLNHFYRWFIDDYNAVHQWTKLVNTDLGIVMVKTEND